MSRLEDPEFNERWDRFADTLQEDHDLLWALLARVADLESGSRGWKRRVER